MKGDPLPNHDHICRYCPFMTLLDDQPSGPSFFLKPDEKFLSVNWLEYFDTQDQQAQITQVRQVIRLKLGAKAKFAVLNVAKVVDYVKENGPDNRVLAVLHEPEEDNPSHSGIHGYRPEDDWVADLIAEVIEEICPASQT